MAVSSPARMTSHRRPRIRLVGVATLCMAVLLVAASAGALEESLEDIVAHHGRARLLDGNQVELLDDGPLAFQRRLDLVQSASHHLLISTFIWRKDEFGLRMLDAVTNRIREVEATGGHLDVLVILDDTTPQASNDWWSSVRRRLEKAGAEVRYFNPPRWGLLPVYAARLHDKILIADGRQALFGGRNLSNHYFAADHHRYWYDADVLLEGPAVTDLQMHWLKVWVVLKRLRRLDRFFAPPERALAHIRSFWRTGAFPDGDRPLDSFATRAWFPKSQASGNITAAVLYDNPLVWDRAPTLEVVTAVIDRAQRQVDIVTPFPNFPNELMDAVRHAIDRGVRIRLVTNSRSRAIRTGVYWKTLVPAFLTLMESGVEIWGWTGFDDETVPENCNSDRPPFSGLHAKMIQIDGEIGLITASNLNVRSTWYNTEAGLLIRDPQMAETIRNRVNLLTGETPYSVLCEDGTLLKLEQPSQLFDEEEEDRLRLELGDTARRVEAYGPMF